MLSLYKKCVNSDGLDFSDGRYESFHLERDGSNAIKIVSDGISDRQKEVDSHNNEAGLVNILKLQELKFGSVEAAIQRNADKQVFADVSNIPTTVGEQAKYVAETYKKLDSLCKELGISKEELLSLTADKYAALKSSEAKSEEGGAE